MQRLTTPLTTYPSRGWWRLDADDEKEKTLSVAYCCRIVLPLAGSGGIIRAAAEPPGVEPLYNIRSSFPWLLDASNNASFPSAGPLPATHVDVESALADGRRMGKVDRSSRT